MQLPLSRSFLLSLAVCSLSACSVPPPPAPLAPAQPQASTAPAKKKSQISFARHIKPILESRCLACHSGDSAPWGFSLESKAQAFAPGTAGPRIVPGKPEHSVILALASTHKNVAVMPLVGKRLTDAQSETLRQWIKEGAHWPEGHEGHLKPPMHAREPDSSVLREDWRGTPAPQ
ncbi:MAG: c-type cytochrome domain-containing protein [Roseimicrobium sp.]